jgi:tape measure domain-containing protein
MAIPISSILVWIGAQTGQLLSGLNTAQNAVQRFGASVSQLGGALSVGITAPLVGLGKQALDSAVKLDSLKRGLTSVAGSSEAAERQLVRLKEVAKLPGLGFHEAIEGATRLQAAGLSAELAENALKGFGNALATVGRGKADLQGVILALGQIQSKGKISAEEINQIAERVPQIRKILQEVYGTADTEKLQKAGLDATQFITDITGRLNQLAPVTGGIQNQLENLQDNIQEAFSTVGEAIIPVVSQITDRFAPVLRELINAFKALPPEVKTNLVVFGAIAAAVGPILVVIGQLITSIGTIGAALGGAASAIATIAGVMFSPVGLAVAGVTALIAGLYLVFSGRWDDMAKVVSDWEQKIRPYVRQAFEYIEKAWETFSAWFLAEWERVKQGAATKFREWGETAANAFAEGFRQFSNNPIQAVEDLLNNIQNKANNAGKNIHDAIVNAPKEIARKVFSENDDEKRLREFKGAGFDPGEGNQSVAEAQAQFDKMSADRRKGTEEAIKRDLQAMIDRQNKIKEAAKEKERRRKAAIAEAKRAAKHAADEARRAAIETLKDANRESAEIGKILSAQHETRGDLLRSDTQERIRKIELESNRVAKEIEDYAKLREKANRLLKEKDRKPAFLDSAGKPKSVEAVVRDSRQTYARQRDELIQVEKENRDAFIRQQRIEALKSEPEVRDSPLLQHQIKLLELEEKHIRRQKEIRDRFDYNPLGNEEDTLRERQRAKLREMDIYAEEIIEANQERMKAYADLFNTQNQLLTFEPTIPTASYQPQFNPVGRAVETAEDKAKGFEEFISGWGDRIKQANQEAFQSLGGVFREYEKSLERAMKEANGTFTTRDRILEQLGLRYENLNAAQRDYLSTLVKEYDELVRYQELAASFKEIFTDALNQLYEGGFKGFFDRVYVGFRSLIQRLAIEQLATLLARATTNFVTGTIAPLVGSVIGGLAGGGRGGGGGAAIPTLESSTPTGDYVFTRSRSFGSTNFASSVGANGQPIGQGVNNYNMINVQTPDLNSFKQSEDQVASRLGDKIERATRRR